MVLRVGCVLGLFVAAGCMVACGNGESGSSKDGSAGSRSAEPATEGERDPVGDDSGTATPDTATPTIAIPSLGELRYLTSSRQEVAEIAASDPLRYGWDVFFYANWPALPGAPNRGRPDPSKKPGDTGQPLVWQTWKSDSEVFLPNGATPRAWGTAEPVPPEVAPVVVTPPADAGAHWAFMTGDTQVDGFDLMDSEDNQVLYEIRLNESTFDYVTTHGIFSIDGQIAYADKVGTFSFDWTAMEAKASWRWLDPVKDADKIPRYVTSKAYYAEVDDRGNFTGWKTGLMGLTGLHLITKALPDWVWITFEQVDNQQWTKAKRLRPIPADVALLNKKMQKLLAGTKWANYEMIGVQTSFGTAQDPTLMANTQMETAFQSRSSCITCHGIANIGKKPVDPEDDLRKPFIQMGVSPPYYVGPLPDLLPYRSMDYVWSLRRAQWKK